MALGDWYISDKYKGYSFIIFSTFGTFFLCFLIISRRVVFSAFSFSANLYLKNSDPLSCCTLFQE